ncbi:hypothetical protein Ae505Ps2_5969 [Pseudonocardia sp. Ae505_Ps2]|nr:hypothetical protein Ae505Ps2_5965 [Pseudonocardia sp. Ae505_Ps2]OLM08582.1 hypothetical protein Ae505Ps2_5969 [Pseudonocardia sp. Ae505_Ps2]
MWWVSRAEVIGGCLGAGGCCSWIGHQPGRRVVAAQ